MNQVTSSLPAVADCSAQDKHTRRRSIATIRRRLEKFELEHLRTHAAELADKVERLQANLEYAESAAVSWRDDCLRMMKDSLPDGGAIGLAIDGSLHVMMPVAVCAHDDLVKVGQDILDILDHPTRSVTMFETDKLRAALAKAGASTKAQDGLVQTSAQRQES